MDILRITKIIFDITGISKRVALCKNRKTELVKTRQLIHYFLKKKTDLSFTDIGNVTGHSHCTAMHSVKEIENVIYNKWQPYFDYIKLIDIKINRLKPIMFCDTSGIEITETNIINLL